MPTPPAAVPICTTDPALPSYMRPEARAATDDLALVHDLLGGTRRMRENAVKYIRKWTDEDPKVYKIRREIETVFEGLGRTLSASTGMLFAKPPTMVWNASETAMAELWQNLDATGTKGPVLVKRFAEASIRDGFGVILVDHPQAPPGVVVTAGNEKTLNLRPTWSVYPRSSVLNWRTAVVNNLRQLSMLVLHEMGEAVDGTYGVKAVHHYRVLRLDPIDSGGHQATWRLFELTGDDPLKSENYRLVGKGTFNNKDGKVADFLPISIAYAGRTESPMEAQLPLLGVAWANLAHWQESTNLRFYRELCAFPQPTVSGELMPDPQTGKATKLRVGPMVGVHLQKDGKFEWAELAGSSMDQLEKGVAAKLQQIAQLGMAFLSADFKRMETAEAKRMDATAENSTLATSAQGIEDAANSALEHTAWYLGIEKAGAPVISISRDYESTTMDAPTIQAYVALVGAGFPKQPVLEALQVGGRIPADADLEDLEQEWDRGILADQLAKEQAAKDALAQRGGNLPPTDGTTKQKAGSVDVLNADGSMRMRLVPSPQSA